MLPLPVNIRLVLLHSAIFLSSTVQLYHLLSVDSLLSFPSQLKFEEDLRITQMFSGMEGRVWPVGGGGAGKSA